MNIPYLDLDAQYAPILEDIQSSVEAVFKSKQFILGDTVKDFEERFAAYCDVDNAIGVNSGTSALHLALLSLGIGSGDEVIVPAMSFIATAAAVRYTGAKPVFCDIDESSYTMDPRSIKELITSRTRAIIPVHLYGQAADMDAILGVARSHNLHVIEDAAQAHGASLHGNVVGSLGDLACFSFYPGKNLGAAGEGGCVVSRDAGYAKKIRQLRDWGQTERYCHEYLGYNYRMDGIQGAVLGVKLNHIEAWTEKRRRVARWYSEALTKVQTHIQLPPELQGYRHVYHVYAIQSDERDALQLRLKQNGVSSGLHYPVPLHLQPCFGDLGYKTGDFPVAEQLARKELSLPMYAELTREQVEYIVNVLKDYYKEREAA